MSALRHARIALAACGVAYASFFGCSGDSFNEAPHAAGGTDDPGGAPSSAGESGSSGGAGKGTSGGAGKESSGGAAPTGGVAGTNSGGGPDQSPGGDQAGGTGGDGAIMIEPPKEGLMLWFASDMGVKVEGGVVTGWADQSGYGRNAKADGTEEAPKLVTAGALALPVVEFDGENDHLHVPALTLNLENGLSFFAIARRNRDSECSGLLELNTSEAETDDISFDSEGTSFQFEVFDDTLHAQPGTFPNGQLRLIEALQTAGPEPTGELFSNGLFAGGGKVQVPKTVERINNSIGDSAYSNCYFFPGAIGELMLYDRRLTTAERLLVETYLQQKWQCCG
jgi:hypothetical protein